jgi:hypothetical protein
VAENPQQKARADVERSQVKVDQADGQLAAAREERRKSFEQARKVGLSLAEIGAAAGLHRSRVDQILRGK